MIKQLSFIHAADLHLDSPFKGLAHTPETIFQDIRKSTFTALEQLVKVAIEKQVDFVLLVGDLFDNETQSLKAQIRLRNAFDTLNKHNIFVYLSYGNHDFIKGNSHHVSYPNNVFIFPSEDVSHFTYYKNEQKIAQIYGFSYEQRSVVDKKAIDYKIADQTVPYHIAMLHGSLQSNTTHDTYAPFQLSDLIEKPFHYWALGHIHQKEILKEEPAVVYPGNTQGRHRLEYGEKGCYHVVLSEAKPKLTFIPLHAVEFCNITIQTSDCTEIQHLENNIKTAIEQLEQTVPLLIDITFKSESQRLHDWENQNFITELIDLTNERLIEQPNWRYIFRYHIQINQRLDKETFTEGNHFIGELSRQIERNQTHSQVKSLFNHRQARKYLDVLSLDEENSIKRAAYDLLLNELQFKGGDDH